MESVMLLIIHIMSPIIRDGWRESEETMKGNCVVDFLHCGLFYNITTIWIIYHQIVG
jgi:hypothetical protein